MGAKSKVVLQPATKWARRKEKNEVENEEIDKGNDDDGNDNDDDDDDDDDGNDGNGRVLFFAVPGSQRRSGPAGPGAVVGGALAKGQASKQTRLLVLLKKKKKKKKKNYRRRSPKME